MEDSTSDECSIARRMLMRHEGFRRYQYLDTQGNRTIGYGRNLTNEGVTESEAQFLLMRDINVACDHLSSCPYWSNLNEARRAALIDLCVNVGRKGFDEFVNMTKALAAGDYMVAAFEIVHSFAGHQNHARYTELAAIIASGELQDG